MLSASTPVAYPKNFVYVFVICRNRFFALLERNGRLQQLLLGPLVGQHAADGVGQIIQILGSTSTRSPALRPGAPMAAASSLNPVTMTTGIFRPAALSRRYRSKPGDSARQLVVEHDRRYRICSHALDRFKLGAGHQHAIAVGHAAAPLQLGNALVVFHDEDRLIVEAHAGTRVRKRELGGGRRLHTTALFLLRSPLTTDTPLSGHWQTTP